MRSKFAFFFSLLFRATFLLATESERVDIPNEIPVVSLEDGRSERFPSRQDRVKLYMSNWYVPPCNGYVQGFVQYHVSTKTTVLRWPTYKIYEPIDMMTNSSQPYEVESVITPDKLFWLDRGTILDCSIRGVGDALYTTRIPFRSNMHMYCEDVEQLLLPAMDHVEWENQQQKLSLSTENAPPILIQFGDLPHSHVYSFVSVPHFKKFRLAASPAELHHVVNDSTINSCFNEPRYHLKPAAPMQPIIWKLASHRHYGFLNQVAIKDKAWEDKRNMAVFRGQLTGSLGYDKNASPESNCLKLSRCRLVYNHANSTLVNARLTSTRNRLPDQVNGVNLTTSSVTVRHLLRYKGIVMLEGNDVASGLKWALLSNSVVLMPIPKHTSWAMEELLTPWIHFVPLNDEATDVEEKMKWILDHDNEARRISYAATLWMQDLVYHPDAAEDDRWIQEEMIRRYQRHFLHVSAYNTIGAS